MEEVEDIIPETIPEEPFIEEEEILDPPPLERANSISEQQQETNNTSDESIQRSASIASIRSHASSAGSRPRLNVACACSILI